MLRSEGVYLISNLGLELSSKPREILPSVQEFSFIFDSNLEYLNYERSDYLQQKLYSQWQFEGEIKQSFPRFSADRILID